MAKISVKGSTVSEDDYYTLNKWYTSALAHLMKNGQSISIPNNDNDNANVVLEIRPDLVGRGAVITKRRGELTFLKATCRPDQGLHVFMPFGRCQCEQYLDTDGFENEAVLAWKIVERKNG